MIDLSGALVSGTAGVLAGAELVTAFPGATGSVAPPFVGVGDGFLTVVGATEDLMPVTVGELRPSVVGAGGSVALGGFSDGEVVCVGPGSFVEVAEEGCSVGCSEVVELVDDVMVLVTVPLRVSVIVTPGVGALSGLVTAL